MAGMAEPADLGGLADRAPGEVPGPPRPATRAGPRRVEPRLAETAGSWSRSKSMPRKLTVAPAGDPGRREARRVSLLGSRGGERPRKTRTQTCPVANESRPAPRIRAGEAGCGRRAARWSSSEPESAEQAHATGRRTAPGGCVRPVIADEFIACYASSAAARHRRR